MHFKTLLFAAGFIAQQAVATTGSNPLAVYWGQNVYGNEPSLFEFCSNRDLDIVILSFLNDFPDTPATDTQPKLLTPSWNFANHCVKALDCPSTPDDSIENGIAKCKENRIKVLLSLGGAVGTYGFSSDPQGTAFAETLWGMFGEESGSSNPFGGALVDGFDFDFEKLEDQTGTVAFGKQLREYYLKAKNTYYLSAAPQCPLTNTNHNTDSLENVADLGDVLTQVELDYVFIQFYNNYCYVGGDSFTSNWNSWLALMEKNEVNKNAKLFVGVPGNSNDANEKNGYVPVGIIGEQMDTLRCSKNFGGFLVWEASGAVANGETTGPIHDLTMGFLNQLRHLGENEEVVCPSVISSSATFASSVPPEAVPSSAGVVSSVPPEAVPSSAGVVSSVPPEAVPSSAGVVSSVPPEAVPSSAGVVSSVPPEAVPSSAGVVSSVPPEAVPSSVERSTTSSSIASAEIAPAIADASSSSVSSTSIESSALYPFVNSTNAEIANVNDWDVVKTTVLETIYTTVCPDEENGGLKTIVVTDVTTVTYTGECECTKKPATPTTTAKVDTATTTTKCDNTTTEVVPIPANKVVTTVTEVVPAPVNNAVPAPVNNAVPAPVNNALPISQNEIAPVLIQQVTTTTTAVCTTCIPVPEVTTLVSVSLAAPAAPEVSTYEFNGSAKIGVSLIAMVALALAQLM